MVRILSVSEPRGAPVRGLPILRNYQGQSREVRLAVDGSTYVISVPANTLDGGVWTPNTLATHINYYWPEYYSKAAKLVHDNLALVQAPELTDKEIKATVSVLLDELNATRKELALKELDKDAVVEKICKELQRSKSAVTATASKMGGI